MNNDTQAELIQFLTGYAKTAAPALEALARLGAGPSREECPWRHAAAAELRGRLAALMAAFSVPLLIDIQSGAIDPQSASRGVLGWPTAPDSIEPRPEGLTWDSLPPQLREAFTTVAHRELGIRTLEVRNRDALDFHDVGVIGVRCALIAAYLQGKGSAAGPQ